MSRVPNANKFLLEFRKTMADYDRIFGSRIAEIRRTYAGKPEKGHVDQSLEAHARAYIVNALLAALNWRLDARLEDGLPNLIPEVPIFSEERRRVRFLDYLGLERGADNPLLIVETKRPNAHLPRTLELQATYSEAVTRGLSGRHLNDEWDKWLGDLRDYVRSADSRARRVPRRAVITNGDWLILFLDPSDAFLDNGTHDASRVLVFSNRSDIERRYFELFNQLEHARVLGETPPLTLGELPFYVEGPAVERVMHGLRLLYIEQRGFYQYSPVIKVIPVVFVRSRYGGWLQVEAPPQEYELPHQNDQLPQHLYDVGRAAKELFDQVNRRLGISVRSFPLSRHYEDEDEFGTFRGVSECGGEEYLVVTGDKTHYLLAQPTVPGCPYHDWGQAKVAGSASNPGPTEVRSIAPRSFFLSGEPHHCAHRDVISAKATPITSVNRSRCGPRSGKEGDAFCEIWRFEQYLCCSTCAFEDVCAKAAVFRLPCSRPGSSGS